jgi:diguanylate cyclase (GGDEF)-like protein
VVWRLICCAKREGRLSAKARLLREAGPFVRPILAGMALSADRDVGDSFSVTMTTYPAFWREALDSLTAHVAILDGEGTILAVNLAWRQFATHNELPHPDACIGVNYLAVCKKATAQEPHAGEIIAGINKVLGGQLKEFFTSYPCHSPKKQRWFMFRVRRFEGPGPARLVVAHENITAPKAAQMRADRYVKELEKANLVLEAQAHELARAELFEEGMNRILELIARNEILESVLHEIVLLVEHQHQSLCCAMVLNGRGSGGVSEMANRPDGEARVLLESAAVALDFPRLKVDSELVLPAENAQGIDSADEGRFLVIPIKMNSEPPVGYLAITDLHSHTPPVEVPAFKRAASLTAIAIQHAALYEKLSFQARHDALADLPNRARFRELLEQAVLAGKRQNNCFAVLTLNLDRFGNVNDTYGHRTGDVLLRQVARRLVQLVHSEDTVARLGSDEFAILLQSCQTAEAAELVGQLISTSFEEPFTVLGYELQITCKVGIGLFPQDAMEATSLVRNADAALAEIKRKGRNSWRLYHSDLGSAIEDSIEIERHLQNSLRDGEVHLHYQPQLDLCRRIVGVEALMRWNSKALGTVSPVRFIPVAEQSGLILGLGRWALIEACTQWARWQALGLPPLQLAVNISTVEFCNHDFASQVKTVIDQTGMDAACLELEITESSMMDNMYEAISEIEKLRALGVKISIDDFGIGYSSLSYLKMLPVDSVKIDRSFIHDLNESSQGAISLVRAIITLAHGLHLRVVAEGVETEEQMRILDQLNCDLIQGFLFFEPRNAAFVGKILRENALDRNDTGGSRSIREASTNQICDPENPLGRNN